MPALRPSLPLALAALLVAAPAALYAVWYVGYGGEGTATSDNLFGSPGYVADAFAGAAGALGDPLAGGAVAEQHEIEERAADRSARQQRIEG